MKILIVDDNQELAVLFQLMLEDEGYEVSIAKDGWDGYTTYLLYAPDLIITDIQMPMKNGLELMEVVRTHNPKAKAIYMSGDLDHFQSLLEEEKKRYQVSFLQKPFSKMELMRLLSESLQ